MNSIALAYIPSDVNGKKTKNEKILSFGIEKVHFNLWAFCFQENESHSPVLDIGLLISNLNCASKIKIYLPFEVGKEEIEDLGEKISKSDNLCSAVFNEPYTCSAGTKAKIREVKKRNDSEPEFCIYNLTQDNNFQDIETKEYNGVVYTIWTIDVETILGKIEPTDSVEQIGKYYLRFRINAKSLNACVSEFPMPNRFFESLVKSTCAIELRLNDTRSIDKDLEEDLQKSPMAPVCAVHFLLLTKIDVDVDVEGTSFKSKRLLEKDVWKSYLPEGIATENDSGPVNNIIAYHFKKALDSKEVESQKQAGKSADVGSWEFFTKITTGICTSRIILRYVLGVCILGAIGSSIASLVSFLINKFVDCSWFERFLTVVILGGVFVMCNQNIFSSKLKREAKKK